MQTFSYLHVSLASLFLVASIGACAGSEDPGPAGASVSTQPTSPDDAGAPDDDTSSSPPAAPTEDAKAPDDGDEDPDVEVNADGCVTYAGAGALCGFKSDEAICAFAVSCGRTDDVGQCKINCEMASTIECYEAADAACLRAATKAGDCDALATCRWIL
jgi:hypothetical protein